LLVQLVRHSIRSDELERLIAETDPADAARYGRLVKLSVLESSHLLVVVRALRLSLMSVKENVATHGLHPLCGRVPSMRSFDD